MKGSGYGVLGDIVVGVIGSFLGGFIFSTLGIWPGGGLIGSLIVATIGAVLLLFLLRLIKEARRIARPAPTRRRAISPKSLSGNRGRLSRFCARAPSSDGASSPDSILRVGANGKLCRSANG